MLTILILITSTLYASVGLGGGSGYLALMGLFNFDPAVMKPTALGLNILVSSIGTYKYSRAGHFSWKLFWPFAATSIPLAFLGGRLNLDGDIYKGIVGLLLLFAATRLFITAHSAENKPVIAPPLWAALISGALIGFIAGITGVGGAIFLSPLVLIMGWATPKETAGLTILFVLVNSVSGLFGDWSNSLTLPPQTVYWGIAVIIGGWIGAEFGSRKLEGNITRNVLAFILFLGGIRIFFSALG
ncbi:MAG: sulfite exporter TauE/SafE family protein [Anaerolineales bacterium]|uniref:Probable membrane transporter protein n=1 Tax=Candidatus Desulfolinea nitratireducens TaxID=2841698 RepID=A0A8J6NIM0_9CHLR|nr:sulfite exporter TauE/SafE family protein [Candidatus Desulfolinea nitratireducens]MBL6959735.1 sulfite exporter TauE/SafE family protein [Anaerolineales bacterium]